MGKPFGAFSFLLEYVYAFLLGFPSTLVFLIIGFETIGFDFSLGVDFDPMN